MKSKKKWMIGLDLSDMDDHLIGYTKYLDEVFGPEEIVFVHVKPRRDIPEKFVKGEPGTREKIKAEIEEKVYSLFDDKDRVTVEVHEGKPSFEIWRETYLHHSDLFIFGEKNETSGRKVIPEKFTRKSFCSVLFVPENADSIKNIWFATDFSDNSKMAFDIALDFADNAQEVTVHVQNIFDVPNLSLIEDEMKEEYIEFQRDEAIKLMDKFLIDVPESIKITRHFVRWTRQDIADHIKEGAEKNKADLIIMGSRGNSGISHLLLGSTSEELLKREKSIPLMIVKQKIDKVKAWDILTNLI